MSIPGSGDKAKITCYTSIETQGCVWHWFYDTGINIYIYTYIHLPITNSSENRNS